VTPSGHALLNRDLLGGEHGTSGVVRGAVTSGPFHLSFETHDEGTAALQRLFGHLLLSVLPAAGLEESVRCLYDIYEFHDEALQRALPSVSAVRRGVGVVTEQRERVPFVVGD
jgi:hypothetical protein